MFSIPLRLSRTLLALLSAAALGACSDASLLATHSPMHPDTNAAVTLRARSTGTVDRITLSYEVYTLSTGGGGVHVQTLTTPLAAVKTCDPAGNVANLDCSHTIAGGFPANRLIRFVAQAWDGNGKSRTESYSFAAGAYPWPNDAIPIRVSGDTVNHMDLVFIPDTDISVANFRNGLAGVIENRYFGYDTYLGNDTIMWRTLYNFYYSGVQGNYEELCSFTAPANLATLQAVGDSIAILHSTNLRDCKSGGMFSSEIDYDKTLVHETGHALFNLKDEYCCDSSYSQQACVPNLYASLAACQADAPNLSLPASACTQLSKGGTTINFWRIDSAATADGCIMGPAQHEAGSDHREADRRRILWRWGKCLGGQCFTTPECP